ncbi:hypothetical protein E1264_31065 [Actinomadura sp. KC216]|uniref:hypothetical protein n=1 Tax=Actinomadura sp. KC216 TaxID=2530370 RepID=UPI0010476C02|nr:hypothetical protein [Actinomadura sp. KC216]TDB82712.1 hypothetical protein E1264_31065 [Actinomadura sp. KC216]
MTDNKAIWFGVRCVFRDSIAGTYEERITLWEARDFDDAISMAESEALEYASILDGVSFAGLTQAYFVGDAPGHGSEVFSLIRESDLNVEDYLGRFFDTGDERRHHDG